MESFKVICKASGELWSPTPQKTKTIETKHWLFGRQIKIVSEDKRVPGPGKDEICVVYETYESCGDVYYKLSGYPYGGYNSKYFIRLDELSETSKEIAKKSEFAQN